MDQEPARTLLLLGDIGHSESTYETDGSEMEVHINQPSSDDEDEEESSNHPIVSSLVSEGGTHILLSNTNFSERKLFQLYEVVEESMLGNFNRRRGARCKTSSNDLLCFSLTALNKEGTWDNLSFDFRQTKPSFEINVNKFWGIIHPMLYSKFIIDV